MEANHYMSPPCACGKVLRIALNLVEITKESPPTTGASYGIPYTCFQPETSGFWPPKLFSRLLGFEQVGVGFTFPCLRRLRGALLFDLEFDFFTTVFPVLPSSRELFLVFSRPFFGFFFQFLNFLLPDPWARADRLFSQQLFKVGRVNRAGLWSDGTGPIPPLAESGSAITHAGLCLSGIGLSSRLAEYKSAIDFLKPREMILKFDGSDPHRNSQITFET